MFCKLKVANPLYAESLNFHQGLLFRAMYSYFRFIISCLMYISMNTFLSAFALPSYVNVDNFKIYFLQANLG